MGLLDFRFVFYNLFCELTVAQHVKRLREQSEALGGARVAAAARVMLQREPPVAKTKIKRPQNANKPYRFLLLTLHSTTKKSNK